MTTMTSPAPMKREDYLTIEKQNGVATIWLDQKGEKINKVSPATVELFESLIDEIENDPELKIDEEEIEKILKEIEEESGEEETKPEIKLDVEATKTVKEDYRKKTEKYL